jgi:hypothetical protein
MDPGVSGLEAVFTALGAGLGVFVVLGDVGALCCHENLRLRG